MPRIGIPELVLVLVIVLIVFGAGKLPQIVGGVGRGIREFRSATHGEPEEESKATKAVVQAKAEK